jgi:hypothetical protein
LFNDQMQNSALNRVLAQRDLTLRTKQLDNAELTRQLALMKYQFDMEQALATRQDKDPSVVRQRIERALGRSMNDQEAQHLFKLVPSSATSPYTLHLNNSRELVWVPKDPNSGLRPVRSGIYGPAPTSLFGLGTDAVTEGARQLMAGQDVNKLPVNIRERSAALARQYGWDQGKFTPKELLLVNESATFLQDGLRSKALSALDANFLQRYKLQQAMQNPDKEGYVGRGLTLEAARNLDPAQREFMRLYNQLVGTISGLGQLVRSGRITERTIERLKAELPNPYNTASSADARARIRRLLKEIAVAKQRGTFDIVLQTPGGAGGAPGGIPDGTTEGNETLPPP